MAERLIELYQIKTYFPQKKSLMGRVRAWVKAVDDVSLNVFRGECLGLVGESGCGKSTLGRTLLKLAPLTSGKICYDGTEIQHLADNGFQLFRPKMQMVFQDPRASLNPKMTVLQIISEALAICPSIGVKEYVQRATELLNMVDLRPEHLFRYPHEFSGGQQQRICIARALATRPEFIVFDEATSALDVSVQAQIINLMTNLQEQLKLTYLFISHDLSIMEHICHRVAVMYAGRIMEIQDSNALFASPRHPYTKALRDAVPVADPTRRGQMAILGGEVPSLLQPPEGCRFHPRCKHATVRCRKEAPREDKIKPGNWVRCHYHQQLQHQADQYR
ncbi:MAG: ABC transporter ATP-binding protein [Deltaproteobacteria bacterium]|nr:ABC transporter ATP-binding protein [Deltaproteobacteria bacterium]